MTKIIKRELLIDVDILLRFMHTDHSFLKELLLESLDDGVSLTGVIQMISLLLRQDGIQLGSYGRAHIMHT